MIRTPWRKQRPSGDEPNNTKRTQLCISKIEPELKQLIKKRALEKGIPVCKYASDLLMKGLQAEVEAEKRRLGRR